MNCSYDGGDCCGSVVNTYYCTDCQCCDASGCNGTVANEGKYYSLRDARVDFHDF